MGNIVLLDDNTINKIAAGEVIERPASAVKEIMENSIDAGATKITVEIKNGGISYIRVTDNGKGIMQDDMEIAFERHATSKLRTVEDLDDIKSMGFRGEALASISAIAKVTLVSKTEEALIGYEVVVEGGKTLSKQEIGAPKGTSITIENLFFNTPVRYKFLKKDFTESGYIEDAVTRIALAHPEIAIRLINSGKTVIQTPGNGDIKSVIYNIYGKEIAENILNVDYKYDDYTVKGVVGKPEISRSNRSNQLFFVNDRFVKDKTLSSAAEQAYKGLITVGRHGFLVLNIEMNPKKVDVNVHPAKLEVRFEEENIVFKAVYHAIKDSLADLNSNNYEETIQLKEENQLIEPKVEEKINQNIEIEPQNINTTIKTPDEKTEEITNSKEIEELDTFEMLKARLQKMQEMIKITTQENVEKNMQYEENNKKIDDEKVAEENEEYIYEKINNEEQEENNRENNEASNEENIEENIKESNKENIEKNIQESIEENIEKNIDLNLEEEKTEEKPKMETNSEFMDMYQKTFGLAVHKKDDDVQNVSNDFKPITGKNISIFEEQPTYTEKPVYKFIGVAFDKYIIIEMNENLYIIDEQAAKERIMYEKVKEIFHTSDGKKDAQLMLLPDVITLSKKEWGIYKDNKELLIKSGFMVEDFGEDTVKLNGVPTILLELETKELFVDILREINKVARTSKQEIEEKFIATIASKASEKSNPVTKKEDVEKLLNQLLILKNPFVYTDGKTLAMKMTKYDIEKKFSRIQ